MSVSLIDGGKTHIIVTFFLVPFCHPLTSISHPNSAFEAIISNNLRKMVTYNATTALMPFYYHQFHDSMNEIGGESQVSQIDSMLSSSSQFTSYLTASQDDNHSHFQRPANLRSIWDLRLVSWMLRPDVSDDQLEWSTFKSGFSHLVPDSTIISYDGMPIVSRGLMEARSDLALLHSLYPLINEQLIRQDLLRSLENIEAPVQSILTSMECRGVGFYPQRLKRVESQLSARIDELEARSRAFTNDSDFLLSSPQQVSQYLFDTLKLNVPEGLTSKTKSSHRSTSEEALKAIKSDATAKTGSAPEILDIILEFRTLSKLLTTYIRPLPRLCVRGKGKSKKTPSRIHPQWMMTAVRTGRLSCRKPNLQQLPSDAGEIEIVITPASNIPCPR
jgi:DNA polymerase I-like protein with 3'-5' exonuclease and polymerase domains